MQSSSRKDQIIGQIRATHEPLEALLASLSEARMTQPGVNGEWSVKDMLAHITWWEQHLLRWLRTGHEDLLQEGVDPAETTNQANAEVFAANRSRPLVDVRAGFDASYQELLATITALPEERLTDDEMYQAIGSDTFRHYPEHTDMLRAWIAAGAGGAL